MEKTINVKLPIRHVLEMAKEKMDQAIDNFDDTQSPASISTVHLQMPNPPDFAAFYDTNVKNKFEHKLIEGLYLINEVFKARNTDIMTIFRAYEKRNDIK